MAFYFKFAGIEVRCDSAAELREALTGDMPAQSAVGGEEAPATQATTQATASQANGTSGSKGNGRRTLKDLKIDDLPLVESPLDFDKVRMVMRQLHLPEDTDQRDLRSMLKRRQELQQA